MKLPPTMKAVAKMIFKKPFTRPYPLVKPEAPPGFRGRQVLHIDRCVGCGICERDCPAEAIDIIERQGKKLPSFHLDRCIFCGQCADSCPQEAIELSGTFEMASFDRKSLVLLPDRGESEG
ncbi:MAG: 4Fe-4S binding protein [Aigarchaeota archaeon]|nr:4Fe-4S binding protein [Aigarchaeota archaeon]